MVRIVKSVTGNRRTKSVLFFMASLVFLFQAWAKADTLSIGGTYTTPINMIVNGTATAEGGGSIDPSTLNGKSLAYLYCVDLSHTVNVSSTYNATVVTNNGIVNGSTVNNAGEVAWLLSTYGASGQGDNAYALQAAIWHVVYGSTVVLNTTASTANEVTLYNSYLAALGTKTSNLGNFSWITPEIQGSGTVYQGLVSAAPVPESSSMILLGSGLAGLAGFGRKKLGKKIIG